MITNYITAYSEPCEYNIGGISKLWVQSKDENGWSINNVTFSSLGNINSVEWGWFELDINTDGIKFDSDWDPESRKWTHKFTLQLSNMADAWKTARKLENGKNIFAWKDNTGQYWMAGIETGFKSDPGQSTWGAFNQNKYWQIVLRESSRRAVYKIDSTAVEPPVIDPNDGIGDQPWNWLFSDTKFF